MEDMMARPNKLKDNFNITEEEAIKKVSEWESQVAFEVQQYENKKLNIIMLWVMHFAAAKN